MSGVVQFFKRVAAPLIAALLLISCSSGEGSQDQSGSTRKVVVGTFAAIDRISFYDDHGQLTGYDIEVVRELGRRLPQYRFDFISMEFPQLFLSLETKRIDLIAMHLEKNEAREAKYLFNATPYDWSQTAVAVRQDRTDIHSIQDLAGKRVIVSPGNNPAFLIEEFNRGNANPAHVEYGGSIDDIVRQVKTGRVDATLIDTALLKSLNEKVDAQLKAAGPNLKGTTGIHFALRKADTVLAADIDGALADMKQDGTLNRLSRQWLDRDFD